MRELQDFVRENRGEILKKVKKPRIWKEKDLVDGRIVDSFVLILRTSGCRWAHHSGCTMCGYFRETYDAGEKEIIKQVEEAYERYEGEEMVKIFTSGSFLDEKEIPLKIQKYILKKFEGAKKIIIESRPEFIDNLSFLEDERIEVAMGLESASNKVLEYAINKGFTFEEWMEGARKVKEYGASLKAYILIKPPFMTERDAIRDAVESVDKIKHIADVISFNPVSIHGKTLVEYLWKRNLYSPPWLWSVVEIIKESEKIYDGILKCDVVAGGKRRGAHNCGRCDSSFLNAIKEFSLHQDANVFKNLSCDCENEWRDVLETEEFMRG